MLKKANKTIFCDNLLRFFHFGQGNKYQLLLVFETFELELI